MANGTQLRVAFGVLNTKLSEVVETREVDTVMKNVLSTVLDLIDAELSRKLEAAGVEEIVQQYNMGAITLNEMSKAIAHTYSNLE